MTQEEKVQELLKPRWRVTGPYPNSPYKVGDLVKVSDHGSFHIATTTIRDEFGDFVDIENWDSISKIKQFPNLFTEISWWEERDASGMPEYVKPNPNGILQNLRDQKIVYKAEWIFDFEECWHKTGEWAQIHASHLLPATESDYHAYLKQPA